MNVYTDPKLLDVAGAMESLPALPLGDGRQTAANVLSATGTDDSTASPLAPTLAPTTGKTCTLQSIMDKIASAAEKSRATDAVAASACPVKRKDPLTTAVNGLRLVEREEIETLDLCIAERRLSQLSYRPSIRLPFYESCRVLASGVVAPRIALQPRIVSPGGGESASSGK